MDFKFFPTFDTCFGRQVCHSFVGFDKHGPAIGIAAVIKFIYADKNIGWIQHFGPGQCDG